MFDVDESGEGSRIELSMDAKTFGVSPDKGFAYEVQHSGKVMENKAYEANVTSGSFECLVCAGIGAK